jgi:hypothetical protein
MKVLAIGDIHGDDWWKSVIFGAGALHDSFKENSGISHENFRFVKDSLNVVFVGDYVDSHHIPNDEVLENLRDIVHLARTFPERVTLLLGNHDIQYIDTKYRCSGFRAELLHDYKEIFEKNRDLFKAAYSFGDYIVSHAGITQRLWNICEKKLRESQHLYDYNDPEKTIADHLNFLYEIRYEPLFYAGYARGGISITPGIFWADKRELIADPLAGYSQIVGHTRQKEKNTIALEGGHTLHFIDVSSRDSHDIFNTEPKKKVSNPTTRGMTY